MNKITLGSRHTRETYDQRQNFQIWTSNLTAKSHLCAPISIRALRRDKVMDFIGEANLAFQGGHFLPPTTAEKWQRTAFKMAKVYCGIGTCSHRESIHACIKRLAKIAMPFMTVSHKEQAHCQRILKLRTLSIFTNTSRIWRKSTTVHARPGARLQESHASQPVLL